MVTIEPPDTGPRLGVTDQKLTSSKVKRMPELVKSAPLLLTSTDTFPALLAGDEHTMALGETYSALVDDTVPNRQRKSVLLVKPDPMNVIEAPPMTELRDGRTEERTISPKYINCSGASFAGSRLPYALTLTAYSPAVPTAGVKHVTAEDEM
jgi:hypothetical protein